jgi:hypothetical protein
MRNGVYRGSAAGRLLAIGCLLALGPAWAQPQPLADALARVRYSLLQIDNSVTAQTAVSVRNVSHAKAAINAYLQWLEAQNLPADDVAPMQASLADYADHLDLVRQNMNRTESAIWLQNLASDAVLKDNYSRERLGAGRTSPFISISVKTKVEGRPLERTNLAVGYILEGFPLENARQRKILPQLSPVLDYRILPGAYTFFAVRAGNIVGSKNVEVGFSHRDTEAIDILVPED